MPAEKDPTVLVIDDEPSIRLLCRVNLELDSYRVVEAASIDEARRLLDEEPVTVVLLDVHVGSDDGRTFLEELRSTRPELPVALLTGTADLTTAERERAGAVIAKPFPIEELTSTVARLAGRYAARG